MLADIVGISAPASASVGMTVIVDVSVKNVSVSDQYIAVTGGYDSTGLDWQFDYLLVAPSQTIVMRGNFSMPSFKVRVNLWSWHWDGSTWIVDDYAYTDIALLVVLTPEFTGFSVTDYSKVS